MGPKQLSFVEWGHQRAHQWERDSLIQKCLAAGSSSPETSFPCGPPQAEYAVLGRTSHAVAPSAWGRGVPSSRGPDEEPLRVSSEEFSKLPLCSSQNPPTWNTTQKGRQLVCQKSKPENHDLFSVFNWGASPGLSTAFSSPSTQGLAGNQTHDASHVPSFLQLLLLESGTWMPSAFSGQAFCTL